MVRWLSSHFLFYYLMEEKIMSEMEEIANTCPHCGSDVIVKSGIINKKQRMRCKECKKTFNYGATPDNLHGISPQETTQKRVKQPKKVEQQPILCALCGGTKGQCICSDKVYSFDNVEDIPCWLCTEKSRNCVETCNALDGWLGL